jgi:hypothetical protein
MIHVISFVKLFFTGKASTPSESSAATSAELTTHPSRISILTDTNHTIDWNVNTRRVIRSITQHVHVSTA